MQVAVNPEFLSQGSALRDFLCPDRVVVGAWDPKATRSVLAAYLPILQRRPTP